MSCPLGPHTLLGCGQTQGGSSCVRRSLHLQVAFHWSAEGSPATHWLAAVRLPVDGDGNRPCLTPPAKKLFLPQTDFKLAASRFSFPCARLAHVLHRHQFGV